MDGFSSSRNDPEGAGGDVVSDAADRPRSRDSLFLLARFSLAERGVVREVRVRNLSSGGLMAEYDGIVAIGEPVTVDLRGIGEVGGRIAWAAEGRVGVSLDRAIDPMKARKPVGTRARTR